MLRRSIVSGKIMMLQFSASCTARLLLMICKTSSRTRMITLLASKNSSSKCRSSWRPPKRSKTSTRPSVACHASVKKVILICHHHSVTRNLQNRHHVLRRRTREPGVPRRYPSTRSPRSTPLAQTAKGPNTANHGGVAIEATALKPERKPAPPAPKHEPEVEAKLKIKPRSLKPQSGLTKPLSRWTKPPGPMNSTKATELHMRASAVLMNPRAVDYPSILAPCSERIATILTLKRRKGP
mmetsp:Transcript_11577/g.20121  ORF Transcript_11577/g.20121 Transcript_11577/m.20121 type:complete len:239 (+) Transcript_11577:375-1091(+)